MRLPYNSGMQRIDGRAPDQLRPLNFELNIAPHATGSVLVAMGNTRVICGVTIEEVVPRWMKDQGVSGGWLTAEYSLLPYSTATRKQRDIAKGRLDGRSTEIQRLIGRSLRSVFDLEKSQHLSLLEYPLVFMDIAAFKTGGIKKSRGQIVSLSKICKQYNGSFTMLFHNNYIISPGQKREYESLLKSVI